MNDATQITMAASLPARFSMAEFMPIAALARSRGINLELSQGVLVRKSPALGKHMRLQREIFEALAAVYFDTAHKPLVQFELSLQFGDDTLRNVDVGVTREVPPDEGFGDPAHVLLAVEVALSTLNDDLGGKLRDYASAGIPNYWVVDATRNCTQVLTVPLDGDYAERRLVPFGQTLLVPGTDRTIIIA